MELGVIPEAKRNHTTTTKSAVMPGGAMKITYESLCKFAQEDGTVKFRDTEGKTKILKSGQSDSFDLAVLMFSFPLSSCAFET